MASSTSIGSNPNYILSTNQRELEQQLTSLGGRLNHMPVDLCKEEQITALKLAITFLLENDARKNITDINQLNVESKNIEQGLQRIKRTHILEMSSMLRYSKCTISYVNSLDAACILASDKTEKEMNKIPVCSCELSTFS